jgi:hypothetical protein
VRGPITVDSQSTKRKLSLLNLARELGNLSKACKLMGAFQVAGCLVARAA